MKYLFALFILATFLSCNDDDDANPCNNILISAQQYNDSQSNSTYDIVELKSEGDCLAIELAYGGGCGDAHAILIDSGDVIESSPIQRNLKIDFSTNDDCMALIRKEFLFDLSNLQVDYSNSVLLNFQGSSLTYLYEY